MDGGILESTKRQYRKLLLRCVLAENEGENAPSLLEVMKRVNMKDVVYMAGEAWESVTAGSIAKVWHKTLLHRKAQDRSDPFAGLEESADGGEDASEDASEAAVMSGELQQAGFTVSTTDVEDWLAVDSNEPGYSTLSEEEIVQLVTRREDESEGEEDREETVDEPAVPTHREAFASFSTCIQWVEGQPDCDPVSILLLRRLQQKAANKRATALKQRSITSFFN